jgi:hypothetical protein
MLGLASTLASSLSDKEVYASLRGGNNNNYVELAAQGGGIGPNAAHTQAQNGIPFNTNYTTSSTFRGSWTVSFWYKSNDGRFAGRQKVLFSIGEGSAGTDYYYFYVTSSGTFQVLASANGGGGFYLSTNQNLASGPIDWHHVAFVVTGGGGSNTTIQPYVNGVAASVLTIIAINNTNHAAFNADQGLYIAGTVDNLLTDEVFTSSSILWNDLIDDFCLHSSALDADNIAAIYNSGTPINLLANSGNYDTSGDVVLYYKFNGEAGPNGTGIDSHGTSNGTGGQFSTESAS